MCVYVCVCVNIVLYHVYSVTFSPFTQTTNVLHFLSTHTTLAAVYRKITSTFQHLHIIYPEDTTHTHTVCECLYSEISDTLGFFSRCEVHLSFLPAAVQNQSRLVITVPHRLPFHFTPLRPIRIVLLSYHSALPAIAYYVADHARRWGWNIRVTNLTYLSPQRWLAMRMYRCNIFYEVYWHSLGMCFEWGK